MYTFAHNKGDSSTIHICCHTQQVYLLTPLILSSVKSPRNKITSVLFHCKWDIEAVKVPDTASVKWLLVLNLSCPTVRTCTRRCLCWSNASSQYDGLLLEKIKSDGTEQGGNTVSVLQESLYFVLLASGELCFQHLNFPWPPLLQDTRQYWRKVSFCWQIFSLEKQSVQQKNREEFRRSANW